MAARAHSSGVQVGDSVRRIAGTLESEYGRVLAVPDDSSDWWIVVAGGRVFHDQQVDLQPIRRPWPDWQSDSVSD